MDIRLEVCFPQNALSAGSRKSFRNVHENQIANAAVFALRASTAIPSVGAVGDTFGASKTFPKPTLLLGEMKPRVQLRGQEVNDETFKDFTRQGGECYRTVGLGVVGRVLTTLVQRGYVGDFPF